MAPAKAQRGELVARLALSHEARRAHQQREAPRQQLHDLQRALRHLLRALAARLEARQDAPQRAYLDQHEIYHTVGHVHAQYIER